MNKFVAHDWITRKYRSILLLVGNLVNHKLRTINTISITFRSIFGKWLFSARAAFSCGCFRLDHILLSTVRLISNFIDGKHGLDTLNAYSIKLCQYQFEMIPLFTKIDIKLFESKMFHLNVHFCWPYAEFHQFSAQSFFSALFSLIVKMYFHAIWNSWVALMVLLVCSVKRCSPPNHVG